MSEVWTAIAKEEGMIVFHVLDEETRETRQEARPVEALPLMFSLAGYPEITGLYMQAQPLPRQFRKNGGHIYIDGPSIGVDDYHPISGPVTSDDITTAQAANIVAEAATSGEGDPTGLDGLFSDEQNVWCGQT